MKWPAYMGFLHTRRYRGSLESIQLQYFLVVGASDNDITLTMDVMWLRAWDSCSCEDFGNTLLNNCRQSTFFPVHVFSSLVVLVFWAGNRHTDFVISSYLFEGT